MELSSGSQVLGSKNECKYERCKGLCVVLLKVNMFGLEWEYGYEGFQRTQEIECFGTGTWRIIQSKAMVCFGNSIGGSAFFLLI